MNFVSRHIDLNPIYETNDDMKGYYLMIDPLGRFFQNTNNEQRFSDSILEVGLIEAIYQTGWDFGKFIGRGGKYEW